MPAAAGGLFKKTAAAAASKNTPVISARLNFPAYLFIE
jgi:hypothetical protein